MTPSGPEDCRRLGLHGLRSALVPVAQPKKSFGKWQAIRLGLFLPGAQAAQPKKSFGKWQEGRQAGASDRPLGWRDMRSRPS